MPVLTIDELGGGRLCEQLSFIVFVAQALRDRRGDQCGTRMTPLISGRGEVSLRTIRAASELGVQTVAIDTDNQIGVARSGGVARLAPGRESVAAFELGGLMDFADSRFRNTGLRCIWSAEQMKAMVN